MNRIITVEDQYIIADVGDYSFQVKFDDEGIVFDVFENGEVLDSTWLLYNEILEKLKGEICPLCGDFIPEKAYKHECVKGGE